MNRWSSTEWLRIATAGIISPRERAATKEELSHHMEDHAHTLTARGLTLSQAKEAACAAMGDPHEVGRLLRKAHQPVLTRLLRLCRVVLALLAAATVWQTVLFSDWIPRLGWLTEPFAAPETSFLSFQVEPLPESVDWRMLVTPKGSVKAGDYTVSARRVAVSYSGGSEAPWYVSVELQFKPRWFWQAEALPFFDFSLRGEDWECRSAVLEFPRSLYVTSTQGLVHMGGSFPALPHRLEVEYWGPQNGFALPIDLTGGVVYER